MDEQDVPDGCIILSPEELAALGVNLNTSKTAADKPEHANEASVDAPIIEPPKPYENSKIKPKEAKILERESRGPTQYFNSGEISPTRDSLLATTTESEADQEPIKNAEAENVNTNHDSTNIDISENETDQESAKSVTIENSEADISLTNRDSIITETSEAEAENHVEVISVKKRGRPKKSVVSEEAAALPTLPKRRRGRPTKQVIESDSESEASTSQISKKRKINHISSDDDSDSSPLIKPKKRCIFSSECDSDSEIATSNTLPKKRGRPKKIPRDSEVLVASANHLDDTATNNTPPRKPGRPRKGEEVIKKEVKPFSAPILPIPMGTSRKGRKRKQINYSYIEEPDLLEKSIDSKKTHDKSIDKQSNTVGDTENEAKKVENTKYKSTGHTTTALNQISSALQGKSMSEVSHDVESGINKTTGRTKVNDDEFSEVLVPSANHLDDAATNNTPPRKPGRPKKSEEAIKKEVKPFSAPVLPIPMGTSRKGRQRREINYSFSEEPNLLDKSIDSKKTQDKSIDKESNTVSNTVGDTENETKKVENTKYNWTGHTTTALNQMFSALQGKSTSEVSHDVESGKKKRRGRAKVKELLDEDGSSTCMVCNETIPNREWTSHKQKVHYNVAWRKGETPIDISDVLGIQKAYAQLRQEVGYLQCNKCKAKLSSAKRFYEHLEVCNGVVNAKGVVTCAVCKKEMAKTVWQYHKYREHNNLAWREGDPALDLQDQNLVIRILTMLYKARKPLHCETCKLQKKSVLGYLSHKSICQIPAWEVDNVKVACKLCGRKVLPISMDFHLKAHNKPKMNDCEMLDDPGFFNVNGEQSLGPRKAAKHALQVIKSIKKEYSSSSKYYIERCDFNDAFAIDLLKKKAAENANLPCKFDGCEFNTASVDEIVQHLNACDKKPELYFVCKLCLTCTKEETDIKDHVKAVHRKVSDKDPEFNDVGEASASDDDQIIEKEELSIKAFRSRAKQMLSNSQRVKPLFLKYPIREVPTSLVYPQAYPWMFDFCRNHYANPKLFENLRNKEPWRVLDCDILNDYLPTHQESCDIIVKHVKVDAEPSFNEEADFKKLGLFEANCFYQGEATIYCGGSITALAWLPTSYNQTNHTQILAVAALNDVDKEYVVGETYNEPYVVQFWNFGELNWREKQDLAPSLLFGMALNVGPVWHLEWCPSGCLDDDEDRSRLGLLAVATSDSFAYIYCIDNVKEDDDRGLIYKGEPLVRLQLEIQKNPISQPYYATKISWTKAAGHRYVAVGYSTGLVALFDLLSMSALFRRSDRDGTQTLMPYLTFQAHVSCVTALTLGHYAGGNRWCFTTGADKALTIWDLAKLTKITSNRKYGVSDGLLLTLWPACLLAEDESTFIDTAKSHCLTKQVRDVMSADYTTFSYGPSGLKSVAFSDWLNFVLYGGNCGEVFGQFAHRIFFTLDRKQFKNSYVRCVFSVAKLVAKAGIKHLNTYEEAASSCRLAFIDYDTNHLKDIPNSKTNDVAKAPLETYNIKDYPLQTVTKVAVNPNAQACAYFAAGYQAGFVRVRGMDFLKHEFVPNTFEDYDFSTRL